MSWRRGCTSAGPDTLGLEVGVARVKVELLNELRRSRNKAEAHSRRKNLRQSVKTNHPANLSAVTSLDLEIGCRALGDVVGEVVVGVVLKDEDVVLAREGEDPLLALERSVAAGGVGAGRDCGAGERSSARIKIQQPRPLYGCLLV